MSRLRTASRLSLGTAQLGMRYGVVNAIGDPGRDGARDVLDAAWKAGIVCIDTARAYGEAETRIGAWRASRGCSPLLISKLPNLDNATAASFDAHFEQSAAALGVDHIDGYLCHSADNLGNASVRSGLQRLLEQGRIGAYGASIYAANELQAALAVSGIQIVQLPVSLANPRLIDSIAEAAGRGIMIFARSVYLQGVLLTAPDRLPTWLSELAAPLQRLRALASDMGVDPATLALAAVAAIPGVHSIVVGAETPAQIEQSAAALRAATIEPAAIDEAWSLFAHVRTELTDPSRWPQR
jgi:aryl-alcohol dehydrogenase-like predicted oxidoreductase